MKNKSIKFLSSALLVLTLSACSLISGNSGSGLQSYENLVKMGFGKVDLDLPEPERWESVNGIEVLYSYDNEMPTVRASMYFPGGEYHNPFEKPHLVSFLGTQMRAGGINSLSPSELDGKLDELAASIGSGFSSEYGSVSFSCLRDDLDEVFSLFSEVIKKPRFDEKIFDIAKKTTIEGIKRRNESSSTIAQISLSSLLYGEDSIKYNLLKKEDVERVSRKDLFEAHSFFVKPDRAKFAVSGSISKEEVDELLERHFSNWKSEKKELKDLPYDLKSAKPGIYVIEKNFEQASVRLAHLGPKRHTKDIGELIIFNRLFGSGGFSSALFQEIRTNLGLAYSVGGGFSTDIMAGLFMVDTGTTSTQVGPAVKKILEIIDDFKTNAPTQEDFDKVKGAAERSYPFKFEDPTSTPFRISELELRGYDSEYDSKYLSRIEKVTPSSVLELAKSRVKPEELIIVIAGKVNFDEIKREFGSEIPVYKMKFENNRPKL